MKKNLIFITLFSLLIGFTGCEEESFPSPKEIDGKPKDLMYPQVINAREFTKIESGTPTIDTDDLIPNYEIVSVKKGESEELDDSYLQDVRIMNATYEDTLIVYEGGEYNDTVPNYGDAGNIVIQDNNKFDPGEYSFSVEATTMNAGVAQSTVFEDVFHFTVGPQLVKDLLFSPIAQNLVVGDKESTSKPYLLSGNSNVTFSLVDNEDKLIIDSATGIISLKDGYSTVENDTIYPTVNVTSNISQETTTFQGQGFLFLVASNEPVELPRKTINFFYPTLEAENALYGYRVDIIRLGGMKPFRIWKQNAPSPLAEDERPANVGSVNALLNNTFSGGESLPHESDVIMNSQDLSKYATGYDLSAVFYIKNRYVEYFEDGTTPTNLEIYISTDYEGNNQAATWTQVNDEVISRIGNREETFMGTPYPGDQQGPDPENKKDSEQNADGKWVKGTLDLTPYKNEENFTLKFKYNSYFDESIPGTQPRAGRWLISDVHFKASEEE